VKPAGVGRRSRHGRSEGDDIVAHFGSISWMRSTLKSARSRIALAAARGTIPASARVSVAATSTAARYESGFRHSRCGPFPGGYSADQAGAPPVDAVEKRDRGF